MSITRSRNVRHGKVVVWHGNKLVLAGCRSKRIAGVWTQASHVVILTDYDRTVTISLPEGLRVAGEATVAVVS